MKTDKEIKQEIRGKKERNGWKVNKKGEVKNGVMLMRKERAEKGRRESQGNKRKGRK